MESKSSLRLGLWFATVLPLMGACGSSSGSARTVPYFQAHPKEREIVFKRCSDDPGNLDKTPECVNAEQAEAIAGIGSFRHLAPMQFPPVSEARVKKSTQASDRNSAPQR